MTFVDTDDLLLGVLQCFAPDSQRSFASIRVELHDIDPLRLCHVLGVCVGRGYLEHVGGYVPASLGDGTQDFELTAAGRKWLRQIEVS